MQNKELHTTVRNTILAAITDIAAKMKKICAFNNWDVEVEFSDPPVYEEIDQMETIYYDSFDVDKLVLNCGDEKIHILQIESLDHLLELHESLEKEYKLMERNDLASSFF